VYTGVIGERLATHVLAIGSRSAVSVRLFKSCLPPNRCAAHREPFSYVHGDWAFRAVDGDGRRWSPVTLGATAPGATGLTFNPPNQIRGSQHPPQLDWDAS